MINIVLSALSGILTGLSFNFSTTSFLAWFSLVPFLHVITKSNIKQGIVRVILFSLCYYGIAIFWVAYVSVLGFFSLLFYLSLYYVLFFLIGRYFFNKPLQFISIPCLWVIIEFLKENIGTGFGWANLGYSQYRSLYLIQVADIWGVKFISFLLVMVNVFIWEIIIFMINFRKNLGKKKVIASKILFVLLIFIVCFTYSVYRLNTLKESGSLEVSVVQPNIPQQMKWDTAKASLIIDKLRMLAKAAKENILVIFPEAAWPYTLGSKDISQLINFAQDTGKEILIGAVIEEQEKFYNSALLIQRHKTGMQLFYSYRKIKLVPFGEYVPFRKLLGFIKVLNSIGDISPGEELSRFLHEGKTFSVLICFEDIFPNYVSQLVDNNDFLVNITNDAWFKGEPQASQHLAIMTFRAVENRISIVRSANTGISGWVSFKGEIEKLSRAEQEVFFPATDTFRISLYKQRGFYTAYGELFPLFCGIFLLGIFVKEGVKRR